MRVVVGWIVLGTLLAVSVLGAISAQNNRVAIWMVLAAAVAAGLGGMITEVESVPRSDGERVLLSVLRPNVVRRSGRGHPPEHHGCRLR